MEATASFSEGFLDPCDRLGDGLVGHPETPGNRPVAHSKLPKLRGFPSDPLVDRAFRGLEQHHLEWQGPGVSNTLSPGPPSTPQVR